MELRRSSHYDGFKSNSERDIKSVFQIDVANNQSELMRSLEKFWKACNEIEIRVETLFVLSIQDRRQNIWRVGHSVYCRVWEEK